MTPVRVLPRHAGGPHARLPRKSALAVGAAGSRAAEETQRKDRFFFFSPLPSSREVPGTSGRGWAGEADVELTQKRAHRRRRSSKGRYPMICLPGYRPTPSRRNWDGKERRKAIDGHRAIEKRIWNAPALLHALLRTPSAIGASAPHPIIHAFVIHHQVMR